jgi:hypothetical protein
MNPTIQKLIDLYKVDNSRETTHKLAEALRILSSPPDKETCNAARSFLLGLETGLKTYETMRAHMLAGGHAIPEWMTGKGHLTKWNKAECVFRLMQDAMLQQIQAIAENKS